jgi:hypothetical protein
MRKFKVARVVVCGIVACACWQAGFAETVVLSPVKDNTVIEHPSGNNSNAQGDGIYSGRSGPLGGAIKIRAILAFDLASAIPPGATINSATLNLTVVQAPNLNPHTHHVHRVLANWGEGTSQGPGGQGVEATPGDVTWLHTFWPKQLWKNAGGDFELEPSASQLIEFATLPHALSISSPGMLSDVQAWHADPQANFGWIILGNEEGVQTARKFASRENEIVANRPTLTIDFTPAAPACAGDIAPPGPPPGNGVVDVDDLLAVINSWGPCKGDCHADIAPAGAGNGIVDVDDLLVVINNWGTCE